MIVMTRVDHRLLHGQVVFAWSKFTGTDCILIANDSLASNKLRMNALRLAKPEGVKRHEKRRRFHCRYHQRCDR